MPLPKSKAILFLVLLSGVSPGWTITTRDFYTVIGGGSALPDGDDESSSVTLSPSFPFFGNADRNVYVSLLFICSCYTATMERREGGREGHWNCGIFPLKVVLIAYRVSSNIFSTPPPPIRSLVYKFC